MASLAMLARVWRVARVLLMGDKGLKGDKGVEGEEGVESGIIPFLYEEPLLDDQKMYQKFKCYG